MNASNSNRWSKYKSVTRAVKRHFQDIENAISLDNLATRVNVTSETTTNKVIDGTFNVINNEKYNTWDSKYDEISVNDITNKEFDYFSSFSDDQLHIDKNIIYFSSESSDENEETKRTPCIKESLVQWALKHNICQNSLTDLLKILSPYHALPKDARTLLQTKPCSGIGDMNDIFGNNGNYLHIGIKNQLEILLASYHPASYTSKIVEMLINIDGLPLYKSSAKQFWPILFIAKVGQMFSKPLVVSIFAGTSKPASAAEFFKRFVVELLTVKENGINVNGCQFSINIHSFICDAPARAFIKCTKGHTAYYGCERCVQKGKYVEHKIVFPELNAKKRTDQSFASQLQKQHHKQDTESPLLPLNVGLVSNVPLEYMHLICLGAMRRLLMHWLRGNRNIKISAQIAENISIDLQTLAKHVCLEFARKPRSLKHIDRWKAVEFRLFLCYLGPLVLRGRLQSRLYHHFMLLHVAVSILISSEYCSTYIDYAEKLLNKFVQKLPELYGESSVNYTLHSLTHICDDVRKYGPLDNFSAFPFENALGGLKKLLRNGNLPLQQVCRRLSEVGTTSYTFNKPCSYEPIVSKVHFKGPTLGMDCVQYEKLVYCGFTLTLDACNNCVLLDSGKLFVVKNVVKCRNNRIILIGHYFNTHMNFYLYPCPSNTFNVFKVSQLSSKLVFIQLNAIKTKCMVLQKQDYFVVYPLLHGSAIDH